MKATIIEVTSNFQMRREYKSTALDNEKKSVDFLITECDADGYVVYFNNFEIEEKRGIKRLNNRTYFVPEKAMTELKIRYTFTTDF